MSEEQVRQIAANLRADHELTRYVLLELIRAVRPTLTEEEAASFAQRASSAVASFDQQTAHLPGDQQRAMQALAWLAAVRESLGLPPG